MEPPLGDDEKSPTPPSSSTPRLPRAPRPSPSSSLEIRLFYVRISPCAPDAVPPHLTLSHLGKSPSSILEINGARNPISDPSSLSLRRDRVDRDLAEATYVSTDSVFLSGAVDIEISDDRGNLILCGSLDRTDALSSVQHHAPSSSDKDPRTGWTMDCCTAASITSSAFVQPKLGILSPSFEVYVAGCFPAGTPLILTQTVHLVPRRKVARLGDVDSLLEDDETPVREPRGEEGSQRHKGPPPLSGNPKAKEYINILIENYDGLKIICGDEPVIKKSNLQPLKAGDAMDLYQDPSGHNEEVEAPVVGPTCTETPTQTGLVAPTSPSSSSPRGSF